MEWSGTAIIGLGIRVCPRDLDVLQQNGKRTVYLGDPEPKPLPNARPPLSWGQQTPVARQFVLDGDGTDVLDVDYLGDGTTPPRVAAPFVLDSPDADQLDVDFLGDQ